jgi:hypothetical protein
MAKFINMCNDDIPGRITLVNEKAFNNVWKKKGWKIWEAPSIEAPETVSEPRERSSSSSKAKKPAKKNVTSSSQAEETT